MPYKGYSVKYINFFFIEKITVHTAITIDEYGLLSLHDTFSFVFSKYYWDSSALKFFSQNDKVDGNLIKIHMYLLLLLRCQRKRKSVGYNKNIFSGNSSVLLTKMCHSPSSGSIDSFGRAMCRSPPNTTPWLTLISRWGISFLRFSVSCEGRSGCWQLKTFSLGIDLTFKNEFLPWTGSRSGIGPLFQPFQSRDKSIFVYETSSLTIWSQCSTMLVKE